MRVLSSSAHDRPMEDHHGGTMSLVLKILLGAVGALVAVSAATGLVAASGVDDPAPRETIVVDTADQQDPREDDTKDRRDDRGKARQDDADDRSGDRSGDDDSDDDIDTARPEPDDFDDDDSSGPGSDDDLTDDRDDHRDDDGGDDD